MTSLVFTACLATAFCAFIGGIATWEFYAVLTVPVGLVWAAEREEAP